MSPKSRGRRRPGGRSGSLHLSAVPPADGAGGDQHAAGCWFDEPEPGDRRSWAVPPAHGTYRGCDLELLDPGDEDDRELLIEARHPRFAGAFKSGQDVVIDGRAVNPRLHVAMHQVVANQLLAADPPETWQAVQRLAGLGYDWHTVMHMITSLVSEDVYRALQEGRQPDPADYTRRLSELPGDWPPPEPAR